MAINRYSKTLTVDNDKQLGIWSGNDNVSFIDEVESGLIPSRQHIFKNGERLDIISAQYYGDSSYYWIIAHTNRIGFVLQIRPGTVLLIPDKNIALNRII